MSYWKFGNKYAGLTSRGKRFVVNTLAQAKAKSGKKQAKRASSKTKSVKNPRVKSRNTMAKKKKSRRRSFLSTQSLFKWFRIGALVAPAVGIAISKQTNDRKINDFVGAYAGYDIAGKRVVLHELMRGYLPFVATSLITFGIGKLNGIIRRL